MSWFYLLPLLTTAAILVWSLYNLPIIMMGLRSRPTGKRRPAATVAPDEPPSLSIIVPVKNEERVISRLLTRLHQLEYPLTKKEVVVVEDGSADRTLDLCREFERRFPGEIRVYSRPVSKGKPDALNFGLWHSRGDIVAVFDADSVPENDALLLAAEHFNNPAVAAIQGTTLSINPEQNMLTRIVSKEESAWFRTVLRGRDRLQLFVPLTGSCQFIRRAILEELGGWDNSSLAEDIEAAVRMTRAGNTIRYVSDVRSWQETPVNLSQLITQRTRWFRGYMETALRFGSLLKAPTIRNIDTEITLLGPFMLVLSLFGYLFAAVTLVFGLDGGQLLITVAYTSTILTSLTLLMIGLALVFTSHPRRIHNLIWIPFIYFYWALQALIATRAWLLLMFRRPRKWAKTVKTGTVSNVT